MRHGRRQHDLTAQLSWLLAVSVLSGGLASATVAADPAPAANAWATGGASTTPTTDGKGLAAAAVPSAVPFWQAPAMPAAVIQGGAIPPGWQPQAVPYQGVGPDGKPITMYFAPTYVFTYQAGPPMPATAAATASRINRPGITSPPQPSATTGGWNYSTSGVTPTGPMSLAPGAYTQYRPVYQFPADSRALTGTPLVPPGQLPPSTAQAFASAPPAAPSTMAASAPMAAPVYGPPPNQWIPPDAGVASSAPPPSDQWAAAAPFAAAGAAAGIAATQQSPSPPAAIASPTMAPVVPPTVPVTPASSSPQPPPAAPSSAHLWRVVGVYDGDTITCLDENNQQQKVRLAEIDAPESGQDYGKVSREALAALVFGRTVEVTDQGRDRYGRWIGHVSVDGIDVNRQMVATGNAWNYAAYSKDPSLAQAQQQAQSQKLGLWAQDNPVAPWDYRKSSR